MIGTGFLGSTGCDPAIRCYIQNNSPEQVYIKTSPAIPSGHVASATRSDTEAIREIKPGEYLLGANHELMLYSGFAAYGVDSLPYSSVEIITRTDTVVFNSRAAVAKAFSKPGNGTYLKRIITIK